MIYPWQTHDYPVTTRDILGKTRVFWGKPGFVQPVIYPWQTRDLPVTTRDFFTGSNVPPIHWKYWVKCHFFCEKMGFLRRSIRVVCMFDSKNSNFSAIAGCPQKRFRNQFSDRLLCMIEKKSMQFAKLQCSCYINSWSISEFKNSYHHDPPGSVVAFISAVFVSCWIEHLDMNGGIWVLFFALFCFYSII